MNKYLSNLISSPYLRLLCIPLFTYAFLLGVKAYAQEGPTAEHAVFVANNVWMLVATFLVFIMHLGFATLEAGLTRSKNTINILFKNTFIVAMGIITYAIVGFNLMYPGDFSIGQFFGFAGPWISAPEGAAGLIAYADGGYTYWTDFIFQAILAVTAATRSAGAVA